MKSRNFLGAAVALLVMVAVFAPASTAFALPALQVEVAGVGTFNHGDTASLVTTDAGGVATVNTVAVRNWVSTVIAPTTYKAPVNLSRKLDKKRKKVVMTLPSDGRQLDQDGAVAAISAELVSIAANNPAQIVRLTPIVVTGKLGGKAIVVFLHERRVYLYDGTKLIRKYRIAIGQAQYPTPTGVFKIGRKSARPTWTNPGTAWGKGMPSFIGPGPNNPLGTRALYVYSGNRDTGVRFHGVPKSKNGSIGTAASHGCMRMIRRDVERFYPLVPVGTPVYILK
jgi:lipoprotein-anchoring transpeptidase ErfK/SrfK